MYLQFSHLLRIQRRLGSHKFPLIDQSFYPNYREMMTNLWVGESRTASLSRVVTRNLGSRIDVQTHATGSTLHNSVTLTFDLLTSGSSRAEVLPCVPSLMLIARVVFRLERGHRHTSDAVTDSSDHPSHGLATGGR